MEYIKDTELSESSRKLYNNKITQFISFLPKDNQHISYIIDNPGIAFNILLNEKSITQSITNRHMFISAIVAYIKHTSDGQKRSDRIKRKWEEIQKNNWNERRLMDLKNELTDKEKAIIKAIKWADIITKRNLLVAGSYEKLLLSLYTYFPPIRADYFEVRINPPLTIIKDKTKNYIQLSENKDDSILVIRDFKTSSTYKEIKHNIPQELFNEIIISLALHPRKYLFVMPSDISRPYDRNGFSKWANKVLQKLFNLPITLTSLRHIYISTLDFTKLRAINLDKISREMGHGIAMQKGYQWIE
jgi:hypothetical protein